MSHTWETSMSTPQIGSSKGGMRPALGSIFNGQTGPGQMPGQAPQPGYPGGGPYGTPGQQGPYQSGDGAFGGGSLNGTGPGMFGGPAGTTLGGMNNEPQYHGGMIENPANGTGYSDQMDWFMANNPLNSSQALSMAAEQGQHIGGGAMMNWFTGGNETWGNPQAPTVPGVDFGPTAPAGPLNPDQGQPPIDPGGGAVEPPGPTPQPGDTKWDLSRQNGGRRAPGQGSGGGFGMIAPMNQFAMPEARDGFLMPR
jgi:hypothetical protein